MLLLQPMSSHLWKAFYEDDVDTFRQLLETAAYNARPQGSRAGGPSHHIGSFGNASGSPGTFASSPMTRNRKANNAGQGAGTGFVLSRAEMNWRDALGMTLLHHVASSTSENAIGFATALVEHPQTDLYVQDLENSWTALHRAFYFGNITIARIILERDAVRATGNVNQLVKGMCCDLLFCFAVYLSFRRRPYSAMLNYTCLELPCAEGALESNAADTSQSRTRRDLARWISTLPPSKIEHCDQK